jgi:hypothetical protein
MVGNMKNYTTEISADQTIQEIEKILIEHGATDIWKEYIDKKPTTLNFAIKTDFGKLPIRIMANVEGVKQVLINEKRAGKIKIGQWRLENDDHARNVAWRVKKDWIDAQMAIIDAEKVKIERVFFADIYDMQKKRTLYESMADAKFKGLLTEGSL